MAPPPSGSSNRLDLSPLRSPRFWAGLVLVWTAIGLVFTLRNVIFSGVEGRPFTVESFVQTMLGWWTWILLTPIVGVYLAQRWPFERRTWLRVLPVHIVACLAIVAIDLLLFELIMRVIGSFRGEHVPFMRTFWRALIPTFTFDLFVYAAIIAAAHAHDYQRKYRERAVRAAQLEAELSRAQLATLKMQLQPHFLFNTLHAVSAMIDERPDEARRMLALLSELLRITLDHASENEVVLEREIAFIERYLEIHRIRFRDRLDVRIEVEPAVLDACVPALITQPLIENAIKHGTPPNGSPSRITVRARREGDELCIDVIDNGPGMAPDGARSTRRGIGHQATRQRLRHLYGDKFAFRFHRAADDGGLHVELRIPFYRAGQVLELVEPSLEVQP